MKLNAIYATQEDIPAEYASLYQERNGQFEIQIEGMATSGDVDRLKRSLESERSDHKETRGKLRQFDWVGDTTADSVTELRDKIEDLEAHSGDKKGPSEEEIEAAVEKRVERALRKPTKQIEDLRAERASHLQAIGLHEAAGNQRRIRDHVENVLGGKDAPKVVDGAREDIIPFAERIMTVNDRGEVVTREGIGFEPGVDFSEVLGDLKSDGKRGHWFPASHGAGAGGSTNTPGGASGDNPFAGDSFNMTKAAKMAVEDKPRALLLAKQAKRHDLIQSLGLDK